MAQISIVVPVYNAGNYIEQTVEMVRPNASYRVL